MIEFKEFVLNENFLNKKEIQNKLNNIINSTILKDLNPDNLHYVSVDDRQNTADIYCVNFSEEIKSKLIQATQYYLKDFGCKVGKTYYDAADRCHKIVIVSYPRYEHSESWKNVKNNAAKKQLYSGEAIDIADIGIEIEPGIWKLKKFIEDADLYDAKNDRWIWSVGKHKDTGEMLASYDGRFYNPNDPDFEYETIFLR